VEACGGIRCFHTDGLLVEVIVGVVVVVVVVVVMGVEDGGDGYWRWWLWAKGAGKIFSY
jgi:NADH:ubiquinone oxidoreductase subunit 6 (subunit J)